MEHASTHLSDGTEDPLPRPPVVSVLLAYAAMLPIVAGVAITLWLGRARPADQALAVRLTVDWAGAVICFLAGVRRGLSFRQPGGSTLSQLGTMFWLFVLGAGSLLSPWPLVSLALQLLGYATMAVADPAAARRREAPVYFQRLRPVQMAVPIVSLAVLAAWIMW